MKTLCFIPAKGVSRGIPRKNLVELGGVPLVELTVRAARDFAGTNAAVVVSTECDEVAAVVARAGAMVRRRPPHLSSDEATGTQVMLNDLDWIIEQIGEDGVLIALQPTSPFRTGEDIRRAVEHFAAHPWAQSLISVGGFSAPIHQALHLEPDDRISYVFDISNVNSRSQRQAHPEYVHSNGAVCMVRCGWLRRTRRFFDSEHTVGYRTTRLCGFNIDTPDDLELAQVIMKSLNLQEAT